MTITTQEIGKASEASAKERDRKEDNQRELENRHEREGDRQSGHKAYAIAVVESIREAMNELEGLDTPPAEKAYNALNNALKFLTTPGISDGQYKYQLPEKTMKQIITFLKRGNSEDKTETAGRLKIAPCGCPRFAVKFTNNFIDATK